MVPLLYTVIGEHSMWQLGWRWRLLDGGDDEVEAASPNSFRKDELDCEAPTSAAFCRRAVADMCGAGGGAKEQGRTPGGAAAPHRGRAAAAATAGCGRGGAAAGSGLAGTPSRTPRTRTCSSPAASPATARSPPRPDL
ncbi:Os07g0581333, partial [Oryza sativa Japonica Group]